MRTAVIIAALIGGSAGNEAVVVTSEPAPFERVSFADLNLSSIEGQTSLKRRIRGAARRVCSNKDDHIFDTYVLTHSCYVSAYKDGLRKMEAVVARSSSGAAIASAALTVRADERP